MVTVFLDFDGVLAEYTEWKDDGSIGDPIEAGVTLARFFKAHGWRVIIQSCRTHPE